jgi:sulfur carrier protein
MKIVVNGQTQEIQDQPTLQHVLEVQEVDVAYIAVALNRKFVPKGSYAATYLHENDEIEILSPMQGG